MDAATDREARTRSWEDRRPALRPSAPSWSAVAALLLTVTVPVCGWMVSLSNRVSANEVKIESLATAAQMAEVKQKIDDWIQLAGRERSDDRQHTNDQVRELGRDK